MNFEGLTLLEIQEIQENIKQKSLDRCNSNIAKLNLRYENEVNAAEKTRLMGLLELHISERIRIESVDCRLIAEQIFNLGLGR